MLTSPNVVSVYNIFALNRNGTSHIHCAVSGYHISNPKAPAKTPNRPLLFLRIRCSFLPSSPATSFRSLVSTLTHLGAHWTDLLPRSQCILNAGPPPTFCPKRSFLFIFVSLFFPPLFGTILVEEHLSRVSWMFAD